MSDESGLGSGDHNSASTIWLSQTESDFLLSSDEENVLPVRQMPVPPAPPPQEEEDDEYNYYADDEEEETEDDEEEEAVDDEEEEAEDDEGVD